MREVQELRFGLGLAVEEEGVEPIVPVRGVREVVVDWLVVVVRGSSKVLRSAVGGGGG